MIAYLKFPFAAAGVAVILFGLLSAPVASAQVAGESSDGVAPDFTLETMDGEPLRLSDLQGRIVVLNFWATWCPPCRYEIPYFIEMQDEYADDVVFVGVSIDEGGWDDVRPFAEEYGINYPLLLDDGVVSEEYGGAYVLPTTFVLDREGRIEVFAPGMVREAELRQVIEMMIVEGRS